MSVPKDAEFFITEYGRTKFYREEIVFNMRVLFYFNSYEDRWTICGHMPWDKIVPITEYKENV